MNSLENSLVADEFFCSDQIQLQLVKAINTLPNKQKQVFNLRYYEEMPYRDISDVLGTSVGGLKASYHIAVKKIESFLKSGAL